MKDENVPPERARYNRCKEQYKSKKKTKHVNSEQGGRFKKMKKNVDRKSKKAEKFVHSITLHRRSKHDH